MTRPEMIAIIQADIDGKKIEVCCPKASTEWYVIKKDHVFNFEDYAYRIAPEPKKRLLTGKELAGCWVKYSSESVCYLVTAFGNRHVGIGQTANDIVPSMFYTRTPQDDASWKSVEVIDE